MKKWGNGGGSVPSSGRKMKRGNSKGQCVSLHRFLSLKRSGIIHTTRTPVFLERGPPLLIVVAHS